VIATKKIASTQDWIALSLVQGLGVSGYWRLIDHFQSPGAVLHASAQELRNVPGIKKNQIAGLPSTDSVIQRGRDELDKLRIIGGEALGFDDPCYPDLLRKIADPPPVIYILGQKTLLQKKSVAIVGSRAATQYGKRSAYSLAGKLGSFDIAVVSGLALGVDTESHRGILSVGGATIAVLGCGLDVIYPRQNSKLHSEIIARGVVVSEYPLGTKPEGFRFPARNRIIAGLSKGVVVVEAARKSGSLITAQLALDYDREVFAVPGQIDSFKSEGTHWLLQQGAKLVQCAEDIVEELHWSVSLSRGEGSPDIETIANLDPDAASLLQHVESYPQTRDYLIENAGVTPARLSELLLFLELEGLVEMVPGDKVRRVNV